MCHTIDMSDHFEHQDKSISRVNFLQYRPWIWKLACLEPQLFQNRLRRFEYENMLLEEGYEIRLMTGDADADAMAALGRMNVCARYGDVPVEELAMRLGMSRRHLQRLFDRHLGVTPKAAYLGLRLRHARRSQGHGRERGQVATPRRTRIVVAAAAFGTERGLAKSGGGKEARRSQLNCG